MRKAIGLWGIAAALAFGVLSGCGGGNQQAAGQAGNTGQGQSDAFKGKITMATSADFKPFEFHDTSSGNDVIDGFDIDVAKAIAKELNYELDIKDMDYTGLLSALQANRFDFVMAAMNPTEERRKNVDFSDPYYKTKFAVVYKSGNSYKSISDLKGKKIGVQLGSSQEAAAQKAGGMDLVSLNKVPDLIQELKSNRIDSVIVEDLVAEDYVKANNELAYSYLDDLEGLDVSIAFPKGSKRVEEFNKAVQALKDQGELQKLEEKWFGKK